MAASVLDNDDTVNVEDTVKHSHKFIIEINSLKDHEIYFTGYNGPSISAHATKKLMIAYYNNEAVVVVEEESKEEPVPFIELQSAFSQFINEEFNENVLEQLSQYNYQVTAKLGLIYFYGKSFNWNAPYLLSEIENLRRGNTANIANIQKNASLASCFNSCKSVENIEKFKLQIKQRGYRLFKNTRQFYVKLVNRTTKQVITLNLDENFKVLSIHEDSSRVLNVDVIRDRSKSTYKIAGTYLDIFDLRFQIVKTKIIDPKDYREVLQLTQVSEKQFKDCLDNILTRIGDNDDGGDLSLNPHLVQKLTYMKEMNTEIFKMPSKTNSSTEKFTENFSLRIDNITEYKKSYDKNDHEADHIYKRVMIANSIVEFSFNVNNWAQSCFKSNISHESSLKEITKYIYNELIAASDIANKCLKIALSTSSLETDFSTKPWIFGAAPKAKVKETVQKPNLQYAFNNKLINHESLSLIKRVLFSKTHLDIFGISVDTDFIDGFSDLDIKRDYRKMMSLILEDDKFQDMEIKTEEDLDKIEFNGAGISKLAFKKLNNAYFTLKDPIKRELYVTNLKSQRKYRPKN